MNFLSHNNYSLRKLKDTSLHMWCIDNIVRLVESDIQLIRFASSVNCWFQSHQYVRTINKLWKQFANPIQNLMYWCKRKYVIYSQTFFEKKIFAPINKKKKKSIIIYICMTSISILFLNCYGWKISYISEKEHNTPWIACERECPKVINRRYRR